MRRLQCADMIDSEQPITDSMDKLVKRLSHLPGIGRRSAQRIAFHLLKSSVQDARALANAIIDLKENTRHCSSCFNITQNDPCTICSDGNRDRSRVLVVEQPTDLVSIEGTGVYNGLYHVLMGRLAPLDDIGAEEINIKQLITRIHHSQEEKTPITEVILATNPTLEGDGTAMYLKQILESLKVKVTQLARGLPTGSNVQQVSKAVLVDAIQGRKDLPQ